MATELFNGFLRLNNFPLDGSSVFYNYADAYNYAASNETAYAGQIIVVVDSLEKIVSVYVLTFPSDGFEGNFELVGVSNDSGSNIRIVNEKVPDENGKITLYGTDIQVSEEDARNLIEILNTFISIIDAGTISLEMVSASRVTGISSGNIQQLSDAINLEYLQTSIAVAGIGDIKTVKAILSNTGRAYGIEYFDFPVNSVIRKVRVNITEEYSPTDITLSIGELNIVDADEIFETEIGSYIVEADKKILNSGPLIATLSSPSSTGSAIVYIDYITNPYDNN